MLLGQIEVLGSEPKLESTWTRAGTINIKCEITNEKGEKVSSREVQVKVITGDEQSALLTLTHSCTQSGSQSSLRISGQHPTKKLCSHARQRERLQSGSSGSIHH